MNNIIEAASSILGRELIYEKPLNTPIDELLVEAYSLELEVETMITESLLEAVTDTGGVSKFIAIMKKAAEYIVNQIRKLYTAIKSVVKRITKRKEKVVAKTTEGGEIHLLSYSGTSKPNESTKTKKVDEPELPVLDGKEVVGILKEKMDKANDTLSKATKEIGDVLKSLAKKGGANHNIVFDPKEVNNVTAYINSLKCEYVDKNAVAVVVGLEDILNNLKGLNIPIVTKYLDQFRLENLSDDRAANKDMIRDASVALSKIASSTGKLSAAITKCLGQLVKSVEIDVVNSTAKIKKEVGDKNAN